MTRRSPEALNAKLMMLVAEAGPARVTRLQRAPFSFAEAQARLETLLCGDAAPSDDAGGGFVDLPAHDAPVAELAFDGGTGEAAPAVAEGDALEVPIETAWDAPDAEPPADFEDIAIVNTGALTAPPVADELALAEELGELGADEEPAAPPVDETDRTAGRDSGLLSSVKKLFRK